MWWGRPRTSPVTSPHGQRAQHSPSCPIESTGGAIACWAITTRSLSMQPFTRPPGEAKPRHLDSEGSSLASYLILLPPGLCVLYSPLALLLHPRSGVLSEGSGGTSGAHREVLLIVRCNGHDANSTANDSHALQVRHTKHTYTSFRCTGCPCCPSVCTCVCRWRVVCWVV